MRNTGKTKELTANQTNVKNIEKAKQLAYVVWFNLFIGSLNIGVWVFNRKV